MKPVTTVEIAVKNCNVAEINAAADEMPKSLMMVDASGGEVH
jgi:hypothetical protein